MMTPLLEDALRHGIAAEYCRTLIRTHRLAPPTPDAEHWAWPVRIRALGRFEVELAGTVMRFEGKTQRKPLAMLKILVAAGDRSVSIEELIERLWPDPEDGGRKAFDITVHRLRKLIACEEAVAVADRHASLDSRFVWVDAWALERLLEPLLPLAGPPAGLIASKRRRPEPSLSSAVNSSLTSRTCPGCWDLATAWQAACSGAPPCWGPTGRQPDSGRAPASSISG